MLKCELCGTEMKGLTLHLHYKHKMKPLEYQQLYPDAKMFSSEVLTGDTFGGRVNRGKKRSTPFTAEHCAKLSTARKQFTGWTHKPETIEKMKTSWQGPGRQARCDAIREVQNRPEQKARKSRQAKEKIERDGYHLKRGKSTALEKLIQELLLANKIDYQREQRSFSRIEGAYRYFDFFIPALNLIIEVDGEFWHQQSKRLLIDQLKEQDAKLQQKRFLRLSDRYSKELRDSQALLKLILDVSTHEDHTRTVMSLREAALAQRALKNLI